jgi:hypothetical protein
MNRSLQLTVSFNPTQDHLSQIHAWLTNELKETGEGYKKNWGIILKANERNCMAILLEKNLAVGFAIWYELELQVRLDIFCIQMNRRKEGLGIFFLDKLMSEFVTKQKYAIELQCAPPTSETYWRKHGFTDLSYQTSVAIGQNRWLYRNIVPSAERSPIENLGDFIALWDYEPSIVKIHHIQPKWTWKIEPEDSSNVLNKPVVFPCQPDWQIQYIKNGRPVETTKAKYFNEQNAHSNKMLVIKSISRKG